jgi:hypothetical protein
LTASLDAAAWRFLRSLFIDNDASDAPPDYRPASRERTLIIVTVMFTTGRILHIILVTSV